MCKAKDNLNIVSHKLKDTVCRLIQKIYDSLTGVKYFFYNTALFWSLMNHKRKHGIVLINKCNQLVSMQKNNQTHWHRKAGFKHIDNYAICCEDNLIRNSWNTPIPVYDSN